MDLLQLSGGDWVSLLFSGLVTTLWIFVGGVVFATLLGALLGSMGLSSHRSIRAIAVICIELSRGTSVLIQVFWIYYALPMVTGVSVPAHVAGWIAIGLTEGSYIAEVVRGAFGGVAAGQVEAATALNLSPLATLRRVVLPQALPTILPSYANHVVSALKETAVVSLITLQDLTAVTATIRDRTGHSLLPYLVLACIYLVLAWLLTASLDFARRRAWVGPPIPRPPSYFRRYFRSPRIGAEGVL